MVEKKKTLYIEDGVLRDLEQDIFGHKHIADAVVESILQTHPPFTIGIFGGWGTGKSSLLDIIGTKLSNNNIAIARIDAWRYSSSDNLRRAFLVHVAKELTPGLLDELREELFSSKQVTAPSRPSKVDLSEKKWGQRILEAIGLIFKLAYKFIGLLILLLLVTFLIFSLLIVLRNSGFQDFWKAFDWDKFQESVFGLAFIPLILAIIDDIRLYFVQQPVTVIQERIDADELFSQYFDRVVEEKTKGLFSKKRLAIFVDNLDRLSDEKMVEALEGLKTYLNNPKCVFIVACDDNVVRSVVNTSKKIPGDKSRDRSGVNAGEHYLDKFFQQTFRLPEYMSINLHDFAMRNFETTILYSELIAKNVDIGYLLSIILPSHINSPRKVKRLLNEFIALYDVVKRRESDKGGQLRPGQLSLNVEVLGKFSTLRAEFPEFYQFLIKDPGLLQRTTEALWAGEADGELPQIPNIPNPDRLFSYLRKTEPIQIKDIDSYIWLSQDSLSLGLPSNVVNQIRSTLITNNATQFTKILDDSPSDAQKILITRVASRLAQSSAGIEQQNSVKILAYMLPKFNDSVRVETAHIIATMMTRRLELFSAREILNVLRWAKRGGIETQRQKLLDQVVSNLNSLELRSQTFDTILDNALVIVQNNVSGQVKKWLAEVLKLENQIVAEGIDENTKILITANREFAERLISLVTVYASDDLVVDNFYSGEMVDYAVLRLVSDTDLADVYLEEEGLGQDINNLFRILANRIKNGVSDSRYWNGIISIVEEANIVEDLEFGIGHINNLLDFVPEKIIEKSIVSAFLSLQRISKRTDENKVEDSKLINLFLQITKMTDDLRIWKGQEFNAKDLEKLPDCISEVVLISALQNKVFEFVEQFSKKHGKGDADLFTSGILLVLSKPTDDLELDKKIVNTVLDMDHFVSDESRGKVVSKVDTLVLSNEQDKINIVVELMGRMITLKGYGRQLEQISSSWLDKLRPDEQVVPFQTKMNLFDLLMKSKLLDAEIYINRIISLLPFGGDEEHLNIAFDEVEKIIELISLEKGKMLFSAVMANISILGTKCPKALIVISRWLNDMDDSERTSFDSNVISLYESLPNTNFPIQAVSWIGMTIEQIKSHLIQIYRNEIEPSLVKNREVSIKNAINVLDKVERKELVIFVWTQLVNDRDAAESFMKVAKRSVPHTDIMNLRRDAIGVVRENNDLALSINNLRLLAATIRDDVDDLYQLVDLFVNLFGRGADDVQLATNYIVQCLGGFNLNRDHRYYLAEAMSKALTKTDEEIENIEEAGKKLGLMWFKYKKKNKDNEK